MNEKLRDLLKGIDAPYPANLEAQFSRVLNRIVELWDTNKLEGYFAELMIDNRGGTRRGFPPEVASDIFALSMAHTKLHRNALSASPSTNPWAGINTTRKFSVELQGYSFTPKGFNRASELGDRGAIESFLRSGMDINARDEHGWTPLMVATFNDKDDVAIFLIDHGADILVTDGAGYGPLHWASFKGLGNVVRQLIKRNVDVNAQSRYGWTALLQAATRGHLLVADELIAAGADVNLASNDGWTPLHKSSANGHMEMAKLLVSYGADLDAKHMDGSTPLDLAYKNGHTKLVEMLASRAKPSK
jgi:ankyrin repeat protein